MPHGSPRRLCVLLAVLGGTVSLATGCEGLWPAKGVALLQSSPKGKGGRLGRVETGDLEVKVTASGFVQAARRTSIKAPYVGFVEKLYVSLGQKLRRGDPLVRIGESAGGQQILETFPLRAPFAGTVVELNVVEGQQVQANGGPDDLKSIMTIEDLSSFEVAADFAELDVTKLEKGMAAKIKISALPDTVFDGKLDRLNLTAKRESSWSSSKVTFPAVVTFSETDPRLRPGLTALIDIIVTRRQGALLLGHEFIEGDGTASYVTKSDGTRVEIELGAQSETQAEIVKGLAAGDEVRMVDFMGLGASRP